MSRSIGEPLANDTLEHRIGAVRVVVAEGDTVAVAEIELCQIALQMLLAAMLVDATHPALEDRKEAFDRIGMDAAASVLAALVVDAQVVGEFLAGGLVPARLIGEEVTLRMLQEVWPGLASA